MSNVTKFQTILAFAMFQILTKFYHFSTSKFRDFLRTDTRRDKHTDADKNNTCSQHSWRVGNNAFIMRNNERRVIKIQSPSSGALNVYVTVNL